MSRERRIEMFILMASSTGPICSLTNYEIDQMLVRSDVPEHLKPFLASWRMVQYNMGKSHVLGLEPFLLPVEANLNAIIPDEGIIERFGH